MTDANILQGAIFHEDVMEDIDRIEVAESKPGGQKGNGENRWNPLETKPRQLKDKPKPAAHRVLDHVIGFIVLAFIFLNFFQ